MSRTPAPAALSPADLVKIGEALFGPNWKGQMARELDVSPDTVKSFANGKRVIHAGIAGDLARICSRRGEALRRWAEALKKRAAQ